MEFEEKSLVKGIGNKGIGIGNTNNHGQQVMNIISIFSQGFRVILIDTTETRRKCHPFTLLVTTFDNQNEFAFAFNSLKNVFFVCLLPCFFYSPTRQAQLLSVLQKLSVTCTIKFR